MYKTHNRRKRAQVKAKISSHTQKTQRNAKLEAVINTQRIRDDFNLLSTLTLRI